MDFVETILSSLPISWYVMVVLTIAPMVVSIPRVLTLVYLICYAVAGVWLVYCGIPEKQTKKMGAKMDDRLLMFTRLKLQDP